MSCLPRRRTTLPIFATLCLTIGPAFWATGTARAEEAASLVERPPTTGRNAHYAANRDPLAASMFVKLPAGAVKPRGWLRKQLELQAAGFHGYLWEISPFVRRQGNAWLSPVGEGHSPWEEMPYWLKGFSACAFALDDQRMIVETRHWIEGALASQRDDGWFGPRANLTRVSGKPDLWPNMAMLNCLQSYYEYTGDKRVLDLMTRYFRWEHALSEADLLLPDWQKRRAGDNILSVYWLYNRTGEAWLLELAAKLHKHTDPWVDRLVNLHNVDVSQAYDEPAAFYELSKNPRDLLASYRRHEEVRDTWGQVPGGMFGGDENCRSGFTDPRQAIETCGIVEEMHSNETMLSITGDPAWADQCEYVAFNALPAALTADMKALRYLTSPNMIVSDAKNKSPGLQNGGNMLEMNPHTHRCCQHNFGHGWPYFAEHLWMATADNGLAAVMYSACDVTAKVGDGGEVTIRTATRYPFEEQVEFAVSTAKPLEFPLYLRVPAWCDGATVEVNGKKLEVEPKGGAFVRIARQWSEGDRVAVKLPMKIEVKTWEKNKHSVSVDRGPLTFSLKIGEKVTRTGGTDRWPAWSIEPTTPWNYGLVLDADNPADAAQSFEVVARDGPAADMPFTPQTAPIELRAKGRKIPEWKADYLGLVGLLQESPAKTSEPAEDITLIPMGAARLRITAFPVASDAADAHEWTIPPEALAVNVTASHCWDGDTVVAVTDGRLPKNSDDHSIARFTWWPKQGTNEWLARQFDKPRKLSQTEIYWFDDEPTGGHCRTPASWRLLYRQGDKWLPVENASAYGVEKDKFNAVKFDEVETDALRIEVKLRDEVSSGVLEWRVPERDGK
ncbi:MAG: beta-L-arabinofuranosidase domain-containing protein [Pirellulales bacterium]